MRDIAVKVHESEKGRIIGACDIELLGRSLNEGELTVHISEEFYFGRHATPEEIIELLDKCLSANLIGKRVVGAYCKANPDAENHIMFVDGVPHLQIYRL